MNAIRSAAVFAAVFAVAYVVSVEANLAAVTYHPRLATWELGPAVPRTGPAMYYYGWIVSAVVMAGGLTLVLQPVVRRVAIPIWIGWAVPLVCLLSFLWFLRMFFWR